MHERFSLCRVTHNRSLVDVMMALERGTVEIALVVDENERLVGTMTDGDVRRALLNGANLDSPLLPYMQRNFTYVLPDADRAEVLELMQARTISQIPVLDCENRVIGLHLLREMIGRIQRPNWAVIMAGGRGIRLGPLSDCTPKPMFRVAGRPILERLVIHLVGYGIQRIFLAVNYLSHVVEQHFSTGDRFGCKIEYLRETKALGTAGALSLLRELPMHPLLVLNGDLVTQANLGAMIDFHQSRVHAATVAIKRYSHIVPYGCVEVLGGNIIHLEEKPTVTRLVNAGIYVLDPELLARVPHNQEFMMTSLLENSISLDEPVGAFEVLDDWIDVGQREHLLMAREGAL